MPVGSIVLERPPSGLRLPCHENFEKHLDNYRCGTKIFVMCVTEQIVNTAGFRLTANLALLLLLLIK